MGLFSNRYEQEDEIRERILSSVRGKTIEFEYKEQDAVISDNGANVYIGFISKQKCYDSLETAISERTFGSKRFVDIWPELEGILIKADKADQKA